MWRACFLVLRSALPFLAEAEPFGPFRTRSAPLTADARHPTCSPVGMQLVRRRPLHGFVLTVDRHWSANRSSRLRLLPKTRLHGVGRAIDPIDNAGFWLRGLSADHAPEYLPARPRQ